MSKNKRERATSGIVRLGLDANDAEPVDLIEEKKASVVGRIKHRLWMFGAIAFVLLLVLGAMAANGWLPFIGSSPYARSEAAAFGGTRGGSLDPAPAPLPPPTPQLSKEYHY